MSISNDDAIEIIQRMKERMVWETRALTIESAAQAVWEQTEYPVGGDEASTAVD